MRKRHAPRRRLADQEWLKTRHCVVIRTPKGTKTYRLPEKAANEDCTFVKEDFEEELERAVDHALVWWDNLATNPYL